MTGPARIRVGASVPGLVFLIVAPGLALGYFGFRAQAERQHDLRTNYAATTVLVRDRLAAELERLEASVRPPADATGLGALEAGADWLHTPFILSAGGSVVTARLHAGTLQSPPDPIGNLPQVAAGVAKAEDLEFLRNDLESALRAYRAALSRVPDGSPAAAAFLRTRIGRTQYKLRRFANGIVEYEAAAAIAGGAADRNGLPIAAIALLQIGDGHDALNRAEDGGRARDRFARFVIEHPWDLDNGYRQHLARVVERFPSRDAKASVRLAAIQRDIAAIDWIRQHIQPRVRPDVAGGDSSGAEVQHTVVAGARPRLVAWRRLAPGASGAAAVFGYEVRLERLGGTLLSRVLETVDLGGDLHVSIAERARTERETAGRAPATLAEADLFPGLPQWKVTLVDNRGRSIEQVVARERWTYGALVAGMLAVMAAGVLLTLRASARAEALARAKDDFVSSVSHELKTPLALIRMYGETLESGIVADDDKRQEFYGIIRRESERLTHLIDNVLDMRRIDRGTKRYEMRGHDLVETVQAALDAYRPLFERAGFTVHTTLPTAPVVLAIDREAVVQSLVNLFQNVIKYSRGDRDVSIAVRGGDGTASISVSDRGVGIPSHQIDRIFEPYYRVPQADSSAIAGSGLGLAIVKHAIEAHGGRVDVVSTPGAGTTFTLVLPSAGARAAGIPLPAQPGAAEAR